MLRPGLRRITPWVLAAIAGIGAWTGAATVGPRVGPAVGSAVRGVAAELPETRALPPSASDRVVEAVAERPEPLRGSFDLVLTAGIAVLAVGAVTRARRNGGAGAVAGRRCGRGATRGPPAVV